MQTIDVPKLPGLTIVARRTAIAGQVRPAGVSFRAAARS